MTRKEFEELQEEDAGVGFGDYEGLDLEYDEFGNIIFDDESGENHE